MIRAIVALLCRQTNRAANRAASFIECHQVSRVEVDLDFAIGLDDLDTVRQHDPAVAFVIEMDEAFRSGDLGYQRAGPNGNRSVFRRTDQQMMRLKRDRQRTVAYISQLAWYGNGRAVGAQETIPDLTMRAVFRGGSANVRAVTRSSGRR